MMHKTARHAIHSFETLSVAVDTLEAMQQQVIDLFATHERGGSDRAEASHQIRMHLETQIRMLRSLMLRSQSSKERLQNEISLVRVVALACQEASGNNTAGIQFDRPARQSGNEGLGRSSETRQWDSEDNCSGDYGILASDFPLGSSSSPFTRLMRKECRLYLA